MPNRGRSERFSKANDFEHERGGARGRQIGDRYAMERERGAMQRGFDPAPPDQAEEEAKPPRARRMRRRHR